MKEGGSQNAVTISGGEAARRSTLNATRFQDFVHVEDQSGAVREEEWGFSQHDKQLFDVMGRSSSDISSSFGSEGKQCVPFRFTDESFKARKGETLEAVVADIRPQCGTSLEDFLQARSARENNMDWDPQSRRRQRNVGPKITNVEKQDGDARISGVWEGRKRLEENVGGKFEWDALDRSTQQDGRIFNGKDSVWDGLNRTIGRSGAGPRVTQGEIEDAKSTTKGLNFSQGSTTGDDIRHIGNIEHLLSLTNSTHPLCEPLAPYLLGLRSLETFRIYSTSFFAQRLTATVSSAARLFKSFCRDLAEIPNTKRGLRGKQAQHLAPLASFPPPPRHLLLPAHPISSQHNFWPQGPMSVSTARAPSHAPSVTASFAQEMHQRWRERWSLLSRFTQLAGIGLTKALSQEHPPPG
ncbi:hypothetical protein B0H14DRAFT_3162365 [Mycena olivaceomarginata]|nr:hypothetical protein B0H14DRAFT_3162365 [Mycena olivaceomarginata]